MQCDLRSRVLTRLDARLDESHRARAQQFTTATEQGQWVAANPDVAVGQQYCPPAALGRQPVVHIADERGRTAPPGAGNGRTR